MELKKEELLKININLGLNTISADVNKELIVDSPLDLDRHMNEVSSNYAYWEVLKALALKIEEEIKLDYKMWLAEKKKEFNDKKVYSSETAKEDAVISKYTTEYLQWNKKLLDANYNKATLTAIAKAWEMKSNMLISLGAGARQEQSVTGMRLDKWNKSVQMTKI